MKKCRTSTLISIISNLGPHDGDKVNDETAQFGLYEYTFCETGIYQQFTENLSVYL